MKPAQSVHIRPDIVHPLDCPHACCNPRRALLERLARRAAAQFAAGMAIGAAIVAVTGNLGAALRALFGQ
jgi:hypothetical protein